MRDLSREQKATTGTARILPFPFPPNRQGSLDTSRADAAAAYARLTAAGLDTRGGAAGYVLPGSCFWA